MKKFLRAMSDFLVVMGAIGISVLLVMVGLWMAGYPAGRVVWEWVGGAVGSHFAWVVATKNACPLILTGLAAGVAFRSGVWNIGAEGQSVLGAMGAVVVATRLGVGIGNPWVAIPLALGMGMLWGAGWAMVAGVLERTRGVPMVLSTILLNFVAIQFLSLVLEGPLKGKGTEVVQSDALPGAYWLPVLKGLGDVRVGFLIAVCVAVLVWVIQSRTAFGFELLVTGLNPVAAKMAGMPVARRQLGVMAISGACAGLAGAIQVMGVEGHFLGAEPTAYGYAGIAVALLGRLHPAGIVVAGLFFGLLDQGATVVEISQYGLPHEVADVVKGLMVLMLLVGSAQMARVRMRARGS